MTTLIVGLGNPGPEYFETRHNFGFRVVDKLAEQLHLSWDQELCRSLLAGGEEVLLVKPMTYMNRSGNAVRCLLEGRDCRPESIMIVYDEVALPLGTLRLRAAGGPAGHRGMESIIAAVQTAELPRLRLGVAPESEGPEGDLAEFVLSPFTPAERPLVERVTARATAALHCWLEEGVAPAMTRFNGSIADRGAASAADGDHETDQVELLSGAATKSSPFRP